MLYRASVLDVKSNRLSRRTGHLAVVMQFYPRFLKKDAIDEYLHALAPARELFTEFKAKDREMKDHDAAFEQVNYEKRFEISAVGMAELERLSKLAGKDVFLLCQCQSLERCHADLLLLLARHHYSASITRMRLSYPTFEKRLASASVGNAR